MPEAQADGQPEEQGFMQRMWMPMLIFFVMQFGMGSNRKGTATGSPNASTSVQMQGQSKRAPVYHPLFTSMTEVEVKVFLTEREKWTESDFDDAKTSSNLAWEESFWVGHPSMVPQTPLAKNISYMVGDHILNNGTVWMHVFMSKMKSPIDDREGGYSRTDVVYKNFQLTSYLETKINRKKNLLQAKEDDVDNTNTTETSVWGTYWKPKLYLSLVEDYTPYSRGQLPPQIEADIIFDDESMGWFPVVFVNDFWLMREHLVMVNDTLQGQDVTLELIYQPMGVFKWQMYKQMQQSMEMQVQMGTAGAEGHDEMRRLLMDTNPWLLGLTMVVSILHTVFDILAFKNDIQFWKNRKDMTGLSVKSIMINVFTQAIIFLYLCDNETSWVILVSSGVGVLIEAWKIKKACNVVVDRSHWIPRIRLQDKDTYSQETKEYDEKAIRYLMYALAPLIACYAVYSLLYNEHKSWYSFILNTLVGCIYTFGFIMMTPQLFINYKLKSVAHLPWKTFVYKALNTFIDDMFAFIIKMPTLHRLSCFRDDIIFLIFLYQRYIYPVDKSRVNEFGQRGDGKSPEEIEKEGKDSAANSIDNGAEEILAKKDSKEDANTVKNQDTTTKGASTLRNRAPVSVPAE